MPHEQQALASPPAVRPVPGPPSQPSLSRGVAWAVSAAAFGFALPYLVFSTRTLVRYYVFEYPQLDRDADLREMPDDLLYPALGCSLVFGLAAFLNYAPARRLGFVRALLFVGLAAIGGLAVTALVTAIFDLGPRSRTSDPWVRLRELIAVLVPITYSAGHTAKRLWGPSADRAQLGESGGGLDGGGRPTDLTPARRGSSR